MKLKVTFEFPLYLGSDDSEMESVFVEFPEMPRVGDAISIHDKCFAPLYEKIRKAFLLKESMNMESVSFNVIRRIEFRDGIPEVFVGHCPDRQIIVFESLDEIPKTVFLEMKDVPHIGDAILNDSWLVSDVTHLSPEVVQLYITTADGV